MTEFENYMFITHGVASLANYRNNRNKYLDGYYTYSRGIEYTGTLINIMYECWKDGKNSSTIKTPKQLYYVFIVPDIKVNNE